MAENQRKTGAHFANTSSVTRGNGKGTHREIADRMRKRTKKAKALIETLDMTLYSNGRRE